MRCRKFVSARSEFDRTDTVDKSIMLAKVILFVRYILDSI